VAVVADYFTRIRASAPPRRRWTERFLSALAAKPTLDVRRIAYRGDPNLIQLNIRIVRSVKRSA
jgi:hypothetical protein